MINISVDFAPLIKKIQEATTRIERHADFMCGKSGQSIPRQMSIKFLEQVRKDIVAGVFIGKWSARAKQYSERYRVWKYFVANSTGSFWNLYGDLISKLQVFKEDRGYWMAGVPEGIKDSGGKSWFDKGSRTVGRPKSIAMYGNILEFGLSSGTAGDHPARPAFEPLLAKFAYDDSPKIGEQYLSILGQQWR
jgi:hypothetical protein